MKEVDEDVVYQDILASIVVKSLMLIPMLNIE